MSRVSYDEYVRHTAFLLWWEVCDKDCRKVEALLRDDPMHREAAGLTDRDETPGWRTIKSWAREHFWDLKAMDIMREAAPHRSRYAAIRMAYASADASDVIAEGLTKPKLEKSDDIRINNAWRVINATVADSVSQYMKPEVKRAFEAKDLTTLDAIREAELDALRESNDS